MGDPIKTGLVTTNFLLNYGFDKIPASAFAGDTYRRVIPGVKRKNRRNLKDRRPSLPGDEVEEEVIETVPAISSSYPTRTYTPDSTYSNSPQYSRAPRRQRPEYMPRYAQDYYPQSDYEGSERSSRRVRDDNDANYNSSVARRPNGAIRRTSSFNGRDGPKAMAKSKASEELAVPEKIHPSLKEDFLTKSPEGLAAGGVGALAGAWLSEKAQVKAGREGQRGSNHLFLTGLGAVVGGLAANAAVDYYQHKRKADERMDKKWEDKFGEPQDEKERAASGNRAGREGRKSRDADYARDGRDGRGSRGGSSRGGSRSGSQKGTQYADSESVVESDASYGRGRYRAERDGYRGDRESYRGERDGYRGERDGRGYQPYDDSDGYGR